MISAEALEYLVGLGEDQKRIITVDSEPRDVYFIVDEDGKLEHQRVESQRVARSLGHG